MQHRKYMYHASSKLIFFTVIQTATVAYVDEFTQKFTKY